jgi:hypothetical protein
VGWGNNIQSVANFLSRILRRFWCYVVTKTSPVDCWTWHLGNVLNQTCNTGCTTREWKNLERLSLHWTLISCTFMDLITFQPTANVPSCAYVDMGYGHLLGILLMGITIYGSVYSSFFLSVYIYIWIYVHALLHLCSNGHNIVKHVEGSPSQTFMEVVSVLCIWRLHKVMLVQQCHKPAIWIDGLQFIIYTTHLW